jgi:hypothetical protein
MIALIALAVAIVAIGVLVGAIALLVAIIKSIARAARRTGSSNSDTLPDGASGAHDDEQEFQRIVAREWPSS